MRWRKTIVLATDGNPSVYGVSSRITNCAKQSECFLIDLEQLATARGEACSKDSMARAEGMSKLTILTTPGAQCRGLWDDADVMHS